MYDFLAVKISGYDSLNHKFKVLMDLLVLSSTLVVRPISSKIFMVTRDFYTSVLFGSDELRLVKGLKKV